MTRSPRILLVDDEPIAIEVLGNVIEGMGDIRFATSGIQALTLVAEEPVELILLDARMPGLDGYQTCAALHRDYPEIPVVFVTAANDPGSEVRALAAGARDFLTKPINPPLVRARVNLHLRLKAHEDLLRDLGGRDPLTGIANRRILDERLVLEWRRARRHEQPLALLMVDIDHFKAYNDYYGHIQGDDCLRQVAQAIVASVPRADDLVARYGGEEFSVLLAGSTSQEAVIVAERIRAAIKALAIPHPCSSAGDIVSLSIGAASCQPHLAGQDADQSQEQGTPGDSAAKGGIHLARELFDRADQALYAAKVGGRNRVCVASSGGVEPSPISRG